MKRSPLIVIFTTVFIDLVGFGIVIPVLPFYAEGTAFNATPRTVGLLFASYSIVSDSSFRCCRSTLRHRVQRDSAHRRTPLRLLLDHATDLLTDTRWFIG